MRTLADLQRPLRRKLHWAKVELHHLVGDQGGPKSMRLQEVKREVRQLQIQLGERLTVPQA